MSRAARRLTGVAGLATAGAIALVAGADPPALYSERIASGLTEPVFATAPEGDTRLFVVERAGVIKIVANGSVLPTPFLDISPLVSTEDAYGLFGLAFAPDYATSGSFYVYYLNHADLSVVARYQVSANPNVASPASAQILLTVVQPGTDHDGGTIAFSPADGYLYFALGDGGTGPYDPLENAQDPQDLLGKMLRLDVSGGGAGYAIPPDNPFVAAPGVRDEIWAFGLRNPFRFGFDRLNGDLWIGDVGQEAKEEVDYEVAGDGGHNYGWDVMEGTLCNSNDPWPPPPACNAPSLTLPFYEYGHDSNPACSGNVIGGYVYRGRIGSPFYGLYFFGDFCTSKLWTLDPATIGVVERTLDLSPAANGGTIDLIVGFGEDGAGELYVVDLDGEVFRIHLPVVVPGLSSAWLVLLAGSIVGLGTLWSCRAAAKRGPRAAAPKL